MNQPIIQVDHVSKAYHLGAYGSQTLREDTARWWARLRGKPDPFLKIGQEHKKRRDGEVFWALQDINLDVYEGEALGIIGGNGAGKSTLLKLLSQITSPTEGQIRLNGRIASLLEVGTGFHPELTGRENIFLNGAILGMTRKEVRSKLDEIIAFAGIPAFIDTPVKRYSSGMYVKLAFAVAAHLNPEILIVDEVLAVGDIAFQAKCLNRMQEVTTSGKTVLLVSHNNATIQRLCSKAILMEDGKVKAFGTPTDVVEIYLNQHADNASIAEQLQRMPPDELFTLHSMELSQSEAVQGNLVFTNAAPININFEFELTQETVGFRLCFDILDEEGTILIRSFHDEHAGHITTTRAGVHKVSAQIPPNLLAPCRYSIRATAFVFSIRPCMPRWVTASFLVTRGNGIDEAYSKHPLRSKIQPFIDWTTL